MNKIERANRLAPNGIPKNVRCYDNGGKTFDRYTVVFTGKWAGKDRTYPYLGMSEHPFHPQGFGQHGETQDKPCDVVGNSWGGVSIGRKCHLGTRIAFQDLPEDCRKLVMADYRDLWDL